LGEGVGSITGGAIEESGRNGVGERVGVPAAFEPVPVSPEERLPQAARNTPVQRMQLADRSNLLIARSDGSGIGLPSHRLHILPVFPLFGVHLERDAERDHVFHHVTRDVFGCGDLVRRALEDQLVMHL
jgi:hypothetical protein